MYRNRIESVQNTDRLWRHCLYHESHGQSPSLALFYEKHCVTSFRPSACSPENCSNGHLDERTVHGQFQSFRTPYWSVFLCPVLFNLHLIWKCNLWTPLFQQPLVLINIHVLLLKHTICLSVIVFCPLYPLCLLSFCLKNTRTQWSWCILMISVFGEWH